MSYLVCHCDKFNQSNMQNVSRHIARDNQHYSNVNVNLEKSNQNFDALNYSDWEAVMINGADMAAKVNARIKSVLGEKKIRKDAVKMVSVLVSSDQAFFENKSLSEIQQFFRTAATYLANKFGKENVISATVHMDETTPHMHFTFVPIINEKLCAKEIISRKNLLALQDEMPTVLQKQGFNLERGRENSPATHITAADYRKEQQKLGFALTARNFDIDDAKSKAKTVSTGWFGTGEKAIQMPSDAYKRLVRAAEVGSEALVTLERERRYTEPYNALQSELEKLKEENKRLKEEQDAREEKIRQEMKAVVNNNHAILTAEIDDLHEELAQSKREIEKYQAEKRDYMQKCDALESSNREKDKQISEMQKNQDELTAFKSKKEILEAAYQSACEKNKKLTSSLNAWKKAWENNGAIIDFYQAARAENPQAFDALCEKYCERAGKTCYITYSGREKVYGQNVRVRSKEMER